LTYGVTFKLLKAITSSVKILQSMSLLPLKLILSLSLFWLVFILIAFSDAAAHYLIVALTVCVFGLWGMSGLVSALIMLLVFFTARFQSQSAKSKQLWKPLHLVIEFAAIGVSLALILFNIPMSIRLKLSEAALTHYVQDVRAGHRLVQQRGAPTRQVGLFEVQETELLDGGIVRLITAEDFVDHAGFVYSPQQQPPVQG
jgi:hypothetical protein